MINARPTISVVIPVHNRPREIHEALDSVMAQTILPLEVIVVDDGSTDDTVSSVQGRTNDPVPVRIHRLSPNRGGGVARNTGVDAAQGDWLALLDSDDCWLPSKLERQIGCVINLMGDFVCFTNLAVNRHDGAAPTPWNRLPFSDGDDLERYVLTEKQAVQTSTLLMTTALARRVWFDERLRRHQDVDFILRMHNSDTRFVYLDEVLVTYSDNPAAMRVSKRKNATPSLEWLAIARDYTARPLLSRFYAREVFDMEYKDAPMRALSRLAVCVAQRDIGIIEGLGIALREVVPARAKGWMKAKLQR